MDVWPLSIGVCSFAKGDNPRPLPINNLDVWVQLHGMSPGSMSQRVVTDVGNYIDSFIEGDVNNFLGVWREFLRVRVSIALDLPLKRRMKLMKSVAIGVGSSLSMKGYQHSVSFVV